MKYCTPQFKNETKSYYIRRNAHFFEARSLRFLSLAGRHTFMFACDANQTSRLLGKDELETHRSDGRYF